MSNTYTSMTQYFIRPINDSGNKILADKHTVCVNIEIKRTNLLTLS